MRFALGLILLFVVVAGALWATWNVCRPRKRQRGMRINLPPEDKP